MTKEEYLAAEGKWQHKMPVLKAYGHEHDPCPRCQTPLVRVVIAGRSSLLLSTVPAPEMISKGY